MNKVGQGAVLLIAAVGSALAGAQAVHVIVKPDTSIPTYTPEPK